MLIMSTTDAPMHTSTTPEGLETKPLYEPGELTWQAQLAARYRDLPEDETDEEAT